MNISPHERHALQQLVLNARAFADMLGRKGRIIEIDPHAVKLRVWAQIVEDMLERTANAQDTTA